MARKKADAEEEARRAAARAHGVPCTMENFMAWKQRFEAELAAVGLGSGEFGIWTTMLQVLFLQLSITTQCMWCTTQYSGSFAMGMARHHVEG